MSPISAVRGAAPAQALAAGEPEYAVYSIGDAVAPRLAVMAIYEGRELVLRI